MKQIIIFSLILFYSSVSSQNVNDEIFFIYKLKSEKNLNKSKTNSLKHQTIYGSSKSENLHNDFEKDLMKFGYKKVKNQHNKIMKIIKICTSCYANEVITPKSNYELLMSFEDYDSLEELLR